MNRRKLITAAIAGVSSVHVSTARSNNYDIYGGCLLKDRATSNMLRSNSFAAMDDRLQTTTGNKQLDKALGRALVRLAGSFDQNPGFGLVDDSDGMNAWATSRTKVRGTWGTVMFGKNMFEDLLYRNNDGGMSVLAVVAHEFAHIAQFRTGVDRELLRGERTVKRVELNADYLSGYYLGVRKRIDPSLSLWAAGNTLYRIGDYNFNNHNHHGTPDERVEAAEAGFKLGLKRHSHFSDAFGQGKEFVLENY